jgi:hypothetical protein
MCIWSPGLSDEAPGSSREQSVYAQQTDPLSCGVDSNEGKQVLSLEWSSGGRALSSAVSKLLHCSLTLCLAVWEVLLKT